MTPRDVTAGSGGRGCCGCECDGGAVKSTGGGGSASAPARAVAAAAAAGLNPAGAAATANGLREQQFAMCACNVRGLLNRTPQKTHTWIRAATSNTNLR